MSLVSLLALVALLSLFVSLLSNKKKSSLHNAYKRTCESKKINEKEKENEQKIRETNSFQKITTIILWFEVQFPKGQPSVPVLAVGKPLKPNFFIQHHYIC